MTSHSDRGGDQQSPLPTEEERRFFCPVDGCEGHAESYHMCFVPPLWRPDKVYKPGARVIFGQHVWVKCTEPGMWERA